MNGNYVLQTLMVLGTPVASALFSITFLNMAKKRKKGSTHAKLANLLTIYCSTIAINWTLAIVSTFMPHITASLNGLIYSLLLVVPVMLYRFLHVITADTGGSLRVYDNLSHIHSFRYYYALVRSIQPMRLLFTTVYTLLGIRHILRYRKKIADFSADTRNGYLGWLMLSLPLLLVAVMVVMKNPYEAPESFVGLLASFNMFVQLPVLCYFTLMERYILMTDDNRTVESDTPAVQKISREKLEEFISTSKPDLQITTLTGYLMTNRSYLSSFINTTYGMNFSQFINEYRLRELDALVADSGNEKKGTLELIQKAGFGSYHSYYRAK